MILVIPRKTSLRGDSGFGLIEIVISMFLLSLLAVAFLPLLITSMRTTVRSSTVATATQLLDKEFGLLRAAGDTCALLTAYGASGAVPVSSDGRGTSYQRAHSVASCPAGAVNYPRTVSVTVSVAITASGQVYSPVTATTLIYLRAP
ncbi:prepilin-type N-terminal cleavage/methylation domain-containing protein [Cryobacterium sp. PH31-AA6]|uniref:type IV pilus modification PilV family protein n=1 Tax=Cryobacterium sp. PH31-AA6 TaxID=3046205 RepID=UPI0024BAFC8B|nr:prepilin-type N-terminal cleavage/methylation domain-containing protein [Cryobacterium sp. PH31-AA6]MDJ0325035.1 prepilin-type N-terminal cleavage/methylation domain-containing protein [Cryobacterium sp. PH31-AA6]